MFFIKFYFHRLLGCLVALLIFNQVQGNAVLAQSALERLEQQIRQRVSPSQENSPQPHRATRPPPTSVPPLPAASFISKAQDTDKSGSGYLGVTADDQKDRGRGVRITEVRPGSPAEKSGLRTQDLVTALMGIRVRQLSDMTEILALYHPDEVVEFDILRDSNPLKLKVTLGSRPGAQPLINQTAEMVPLPPGESITAENPPNESHALSDREMIEQLQQRIIELERRVAELERVLSEAQKNK